MTFQPLEVGDFSTVDDTRNLTPHKCPEVAPVHYTCLGFLEKSR